MQRIICLVGLFVILFSQQSFSSIALSEKTDISILTCGTSNMIHTMYGHTAIRVKDPEQRLDIVFNYGVFSFSKPHFVYRFAKGQTDYMLVPERYDEFYEGYIERGRSIYEQVLDLNPSEKQKLWDFLVENAQPENREYRYNFFRDNCATRVRDVVRNQMEQPAVFPEDGEGMTFRQHIHHYQRVMPWVNFGIDLALGSPADQVASAWQEMFLPDYLMKHFGNAKISTGQGKKPLVKETKTIYEHEQGESESHIMTPVSVFAVSLALVMLTSWRQFRKKKINYWVDYLLLFLTGFTGLAVLWLMNFSEHPAVQSNYNFLWAVPFNLLFMFAWMKRKWRPLVRWYWPILGAWLTLFLLFGFLVPQSFHPAVYLIVAMMISRAVLNTVVKQKS